MAIGKIEIVNYSEPIRCWKYMEMFAFLPCIGTFKTRSNTGCPGRSIFIQWLGWMVAVEWDLKK